IRGVVAVCVAHPNTVISIMVYMATGSLDAFAAGVSDPGYMPVNRIARNANICPFLYMPRCVSPSAILGGKCEKNGPKLTHAADIAAGSVLAGHPPALAGGSSTHPSKLPDIILYVL